MASLDSIYDLTETLDKEGFDYVVISLRRTVKENKANVYIALADGDSAKLMSKTLEEVKKQIDEMGEKE